MTIIAEVIGNIYTVAKLIHTQVQTAKANKEQCQTLSKRVNAITDAIKNLDVQTDNLHYIAALQDLKKNLDKCLEFISMYSKDKNWFKQVIKAGSAKEQFEELNRKLLEAILPLNLGINAQQIFNREQDNADRIKDSEEIRNKQDEIIALNQQANLALQKIQASQDEHKDIILNQLASLKAQLLAVLNTNNVPVLPLIEAHLLIPYHELGFDDMIAEGSCGKVYAGQWGGEKVAIKSLEIESKSDDFSELIREVQILSQLHHKNVVALRGACLNPPCFAMEFMMQGSLESFLEKGKLSPDKQKQIALDIARGLAYLHSRDILHRDLKSANILVDEKGQAKLSDFGLSKIKAQNVKTRNRASLGIAWQAPECFAMGVPYSTKSDVYSFGMILWEIMSGKKPYASHFKDQGFVRDTNIISHVQNGQREELTSDIPDFYKKLISDCWSQKPFNRPDMNSIVQQLESLHLNDSKEEDITGEKAYEIGIQYERNKQFKSAYDAYEKSASKGYSKAYTNLGFLRLKGVAGVVSQDKPEALKLFLEAANKGHVRAMGNAANMFKRGDGVPKNIAQALNWYSKAADAGDQNAAAECEKLKLETLESGYMNNLATMGLK